MSTAYELAKRYYPRLWDIARLDKLVELNDKKPGAGITAEEFREITGTEYAEG